MVAVLAMNATPSYAAGGQTGQISGVVIDATSKAPIANARVTAAAPAGVRSFVLNSNGNLAPTLDGVNGQADITISSAGAFGGITT